MATPDLIQLILLTAGVSVVVLSCGGMLVRNDAFIRLHLTGLTSVLAATLISAAIVVGNGLSVMGLKALATALILAIAGPVTSHAVARAARIRYFGFWQPTDQELRTDQIAASRSASRESDGNEDFGSSGGAKQ